MVKAIGAAPEVHAAIECLGRLTDVFEQRRQQLAQGAGLTEQQWRVLEEISSEHFMPSMFARRRESTAAAVSKILRQLADKALISVSVSKEDGRHREYVLTAKGKRALERVRETREQAIRDVWIGLDRDAVKAFAAFGSELIQRLEEYARRAEGKE